MSCHDTYCCIHAGVCSLVFYARLGPTQPACPPHASLVAAAVAATAKPLEPKPPAYPPPVTLVAAAAAPTATPEPKPPAFAPPADASVVSAAAAQTHASEPKPRPVVIHASHAARPLRLGAGGVRYHVYMAVCGGSWTLIWAVAKTHYTYWTMARAMHRLPWR